MIRVTSAIKYAKIVKTNFNLDKNEKDIKYIYKISA